MTPSSLTQCYSSDIKGSNGFFFTESNTKLTFFLWYPDLVKLYFSDSKIVVEHSSGTLIIKGDHLFPIAEDIAKEKLMKVKMSLPIEEQMAQNARSVYVTEIIWIGELNDQEEPT